MQMSEQNLKPTAVTSVTSSVEQLEEQLRNTGLTKDDIITLIHKRCKGRVTKTQVRHTLEGIKQLEKDLTKK